MAKHHSNFSGLTAQDMQSMLVADQFIANLIHNSNSADSKTLSVSILGHDAKNQAFIGPYSAYYEHQNMKNAQVQELALKKLDVHLCALKAKSIATTKNMAKFIKFFVLKNADFVRDQLDSRNGLKFNNRINAWCTALEILFAEGVTPENLVSTLKARGGIEGIRKASLNKKNKPIAILESSAEQLGLGDFQGELVLIAIRKPDGSIEIKQAVPSQLAVDLVKVVIDDMAK